MQSSEFKGSPALAQFLSQATPSSAFDLEDALPSTLSRKTAVDVQAQAAAVTSTVTPIAAAYYEN